MPLITISLFLTSIKWGEDNKNTEFIKRRIIPKSNPFVNISRGDYLFLSEYPIMEVNDALLDKLSDLARLYIEPKEREGLKQDLQRMISFVEKLQELDTGETGPLLHMTDSADVLRDDVVEGSVTREEAMINAPDSDGVFFRVPKVIKKDKPEM